MRLVIDRLAVVEVGSAVREAGERSRVGHPQESTLPERHRRALAADLSDPHLAGGADLAIDAQVPRDQVVAGRQAVRLEQLGDLAAQELLGQGERLLGEAAWSDGDVDVHPSSVARRVDDNRDGVRLVDVLGQCEEGGAQSRVLEDSCRPRKELAAHHDPTLRGVRAHAIDEALRAADACHVRSRHQLERRGRQVDGDGTRETGSVAQAREPGVVRGEDLERRGALGETGRRGVDRGGEDRVVHAAARPSPVQRGVDRARHDRGVAASSGHESHLDARQSASPVMRRHPECGGPPDRVERRLEGHGGDERLGPQHDYRDPHREGRDHDPPGQHAPLLGGPATGAGGRRAGRQGRAHASVAMTSSRLRVIRCVAPQIT